MNRTQRIAAAAASALVVGVLAAGCGGSDTEGSGNDKVTLRVNLFGQFGYKDLYKKFEKDHPGVKIVETAEGDLGKYNTKLSQQIAANAAAGDVVAIEEGQTVNFLQTADKFVNLQDHGYDKLKDAYLPYVANAATSADGKTTIGLGTDVGGLAMCYRRDLFEKAGLPSDREEVAKLWPTWDDFIATGEKFTRRHRGQEGPLHRCGHQRLQLDPDAGRRSDVLRSRQQADRRLQPRGQERVGPRQQDDRREAHRQARRPSPRSGTPASRTARSRPSRARRG